MKIIFNLILALLAVAIGLSSCSKDDDDNNGSSGGAGFFYSENGSASQIKVDDVKANKQYKTIIAKISSTNSIEIVLSGLEAGTYDLSKKYAFSYLKEGGIWEASAGTLTITSNDGSKLSGTFNASAGSGITGITKVEGKFNDVTIQ